MFQHIKEIIFKKIISKLERRVAFDLIENINYQTYRVAAEDTARYVIKKMYKIRRFRNAKELLNHAFNNILIKDGDIIEMGVFNGDSINFISSLTRKKVYGFDSFIGYPEHWRENIGKEHFDLHGVLPKVNKNVELVKGWYSDTLPKMIKKFKALSFLHMDSNLYTSTKEAFGLLKDKIVPGTVIVFDDYFNYPNWQEGEFKAFHELLKKSRLRYEYLGYAITQVAVRIK